MLEMKNVVNVHMEPLTVLGTVKKGRYEEIGELIEKLFNFASEKGINIEGSPLYVCHESCIEEMKKADMEGNAQIEVAVPISGKAEEGKDIKIYQLQGGQMAMIKHIGPYEGCESSYKRLFSWIKERKREIVGPIREVYLNDPEKVPKEDIQTQIYAPIGG